MDIHCISYDVNNIFIMDLSLDNNFEVCAGKIYDFSEKLYQSLNYYKNNIISLSEFLDDVEDETGILPRHILSPGNFDELSEFLDEQDMADLLESVINIETKNSSIQLAPIEMCDYVL